MVPDLAPQNRGKFNGPAPMLPRVIFKAALVNGSEHTQARLQRPVAQLLAWAAISGSERLFGLAKHRRRLPRSKFIREHNSSSRLRPPTKIEEEALNFLAVSQTALHYGIVATQFAAPLQLR